MKTRNANTPKSTTTAKKTPVAKKFAAKTPPKPTEPLPDSSATPKSAEVKSVSAAKAKQVKGATATNSAAPESMAEPPAVKEANAVADAVQVTTEKKAAPGAKKTRTVIRKVMVRRKTKVSVKAVSGETCKSGEPEQTKVEESSKKEGAQDVESANKEEQIPVNTEVSTNKEDQIPVNTEVLTNKDETPVENVEGSTKEDQNVGDVEESMKKEETASDAQSLVENVVVSSKEEDPVVTDTVESPENQETSMTEAVVEEKETKVVEDKMEPNNEPINMEKDVNEGLEVEDDPTKEDVSHGDEKTEEHVDLEVHEEVGDEELVEDHVVEHGEKAKALEEEPEAEVMKEEPAAEAMKEEPAAEAMEEEPAAEAMEEEPAAEAMEEEPAAEAMEEEPAAEAMEEEPAAEAMEEEPAAEALEEEPAAEALEEERAELTALAQERKIKKELEIFVGGLDRGTTEEDVKKVFVDVGEVVEVRLHKSSSTSKNKGYAFVKFATKEQASRALAEIKNPIINGKRCGTAPSEDNNTLFLGNICNSWTKEAIKQKLKDYAIEGVESITLVPNPQHEGLSRGFAFVEFYCHADAMLAYKRLQKPDVIFGHSERTAKVAFAEPLREPDPEVMAQVKSVFVDGLPQYWDEDRVRKQFKGYGEIERITLARNMSTAKRKDFGFVDFTTHEAAIACIDDINTKELGDGNKKTKVKARLSNPQPKIQVVKGGMCGGFRIGRGGGGTFPKNGRAFGRGGHSFNQTGFQGSSRGFYQRGRGQPGMGFATEHDIDTPYASFQGRQNFGRAGGRWGPFRGAHHASGGSNLPARVNLDRHRYGATDRGSGRNMPLRGQPFPPEEELNRPFLGRHSDDPYLYDDSPHGMKRPYFADHDPDYLEPSRVRPRLDYADPAVPPRGSYYRDNIEAGSGLYPHSRDYYGPDYSAGAHSSFYGGHRPYGGGYYY